MNFLINLKIIQNKFIHKILKLLLYGKINLILKKNLWKNSLKLIKDFLVKQKQKKEICKEHKILYKMKQREKILILFHLFLLIFTDLIKHFHNILY